MARTTKTLKTEFLSIVKVAAKTSDRVQRWLVDAGDHYIQHGDTSLIGWAIENSWSSGMKREAMVRWVSRNLKITVVSAVKGKVTCEIRNKKRDTLDMIAAASDLFYLDVEKAEKRAKAEEVVAAEEVDAADGGGDAAAPEAPKPFNLKEFAFDVAAKAQKNGVTLLELTEAIEAVFKVGEAKEGLKPVGRPQFDKNMGVRIAS